MKKKLTIKPKVDLTKFIYDQNNEHEQKFDGAVNLKANSCNLDLETDTKIQPQIKNSSLNVQKKNNKSKTLLKLRKSRGNEIKAQTIINRAYTKENLEDYRSQFQQSYEKLSQKYYDALDSPSKIPDILESSEDEILLDGNESLKRKHTTESNESISSDDLVLPSQQDLEFVVYKKKKNLYNELFHTDITETRTNNQERENPSIKEESSVIPLTLSQIFEKSVDEVEEINLSDSEKSEEHIVLSDSYNENELLIDKSSDGDENLIVKKMDTEIRVILSDSSDEEPVIIQSQFDSPTKFNSETHVCVEADQERTNFKMNEINNMMSEAGIIFNNKDLIKIISEDTNVRQFLTNSSTKLEADVLDNLTKQKNMTLLKNELFEIFQQGKPSKIYDYICKLIKNMARSEVSSNSEEDEFTKVLIGISTGKVFNLEYFTNVIFSKLCACEDVDSVKIMALSKLIHQKKLKSLYESKFGANFEMG